jgi:hypothetical protein
VPLTPPIPSAWKRPVLSTDGRLFRVIQVCSNVRTKGSNLYYTPEFLDVNGPTITSLEVPATSTSPAVTVRWTAQDPTPGAGVADYEVQVRTDNGPCQWAVPGGVTPVATLNDHPVGAGHHYAFQVRARDRVGNWGAWVSGTTVAQ